LSTDNDDAWKAEQRYRAVLEAGDGGSVSEIAARYGVSRQTIYTWRRRYAEHGVGGLQEASQRPHHMPRRVDAEGEALICELRRERPRWGARRVRHELTRRTVNPVPSRATVHRILHRNGLVNVHDQHHKRKYKRWQREAPMQLWQLDLVGGVFLADGRECKMVTGIDDHSRFIVIAAVVVVPTGRAVVEAFTAAMRRYGVPSEVLSDNGKQFTGRFTRPFPAEVLFERVCRENGISQRLTKRRSPTTTGKIERWHKTLREELLDQVGAFASLDAAQEAIDEWVHAYNHGRPHQALDMATPGSVFRPSTPKSITVPADGIHVPEPDPEIAAVIVDIPPPPTGGVAAVEWEASVPPSGHFNLGGGQELWLGPAFSGRTVTVWADACSVHVTMEEHHVKTVGSRLNETTCAT
jgi:transposase InsO family protein